MLEVSKLTDLVSKRPIFFILTFDKFIIKYVLVRNVYSAFFVTFVTVPFC